MSVHPVFFIIFVSVLSCYCPAQSLDSFYKAALEYRSSIKERRLAEQIAEEQKDQAVSQVLPKIAASSTNVWREQANVGAFGEGYQHTAGINLKQPLFQGGSEYYNLGVAKNLPAIARIEKEQEKITLFVNVAQAYFWTYRVQKNFDLYKEQEETLQSIVRKLSERAKIGRSKKTDVLAAQSQLARVVAERSIIERQLVAAKADLINLTGVQSLNIINNEEPLQLIYNPEWKKKIQQTPQIQLNEKLLENSKKKVRSAQGTFLPKLDLNGNYYLDRAGILSDSHWDMTVNATWEIYSGGNDSSEVRIQRLQYSQIASRLNELRRNTDNNFESIKNVFQINQRTTKDLKRAVDLAKKNYQEHLKEARRGLVNELDALRVLEDFLQVSRTYDQQIYDTQMSWVQLRAMAGDHP